VLAADSRVTLMAGIQIPGLQLPAGTQLLVPATFDNATKLINSTSQRFIAAVTFGTGAIGQKGTAYSGQLHARVRCSISEGARWQDKNDQRLTVEQSPKSWGIFFSRTLIVATKIKQLGVRFG